MLVLAACAPAALRVDPATSAPAAMPSPPVPIPTGTAIAERLALAERAGAAVGEAAARATVDPGMVDPGEVDPGLPPAVAAGPGAAPERRRPGRAPEVRRGPSTRTAPRELAAQVGSGQNVRVATVRIVDGAASVQVVGATGREQTEQRIAAAQADPTVVAVELDHRVRLAAHARGTESAAPPTSAVSFALADDPHRGQQWALDELGAESVWGVSRGSGQVVAVIDSGVDGTHPDLAGQVLPGVDYVAGGKGWNDQYGHGTHVAGIVAAVAGNRLGVAGFAPDARILPVRVLDGDGAGWDSDIAAGLIWAADQGAHVVNLSLGGPDASDAVRAAVAYAVGRGAVVVAAVGNERATGDPINYPAGFALPGELGIAATTRARVSAPYSNTGAYVSLAAPGDGILSTLDGAYFSLSGTSMAAPYASAAVALVRSAVPALGPIEVVARLTATARDLESAGWDDATGAGLIDPGAALCALGRCPAGASTPDRPAPSDPPSPSDPPAPSGSPASPSPPSAAPSPSPDGQPAETVPLRIAVRTATARVLAGRSGVLTVAVSDPRGPVVGALVRLTSGRSALSTRSDGTGIAQFRVTPGRTATWTLMATADGHAAATGRWTLTVVPVVTVRWQGNRATITVSPARGQVVTSGRGTSARVRRTLPTASSARVSLSVPKSGAARVTVGAGGGLAGVSVARPS